MRRRGGPLARAILHLACLTLAGCGAVSVTVTRTTTAPVSRQASRPSRTPASSQPSGFTPQAAEVVVAFADEYINWNSHTVSGVMRRLAGQSVGQAHSAMELAAGETARDYELQRGGITNSGQIEAVGPLTGTRNQWVVVTRERTTATASNAYQGLQPAWHVIVAAAVELSSGRWAVSLWQPEN